MCAYRALAESDVEAKETHEQSLPWFEPSGKAANDSEILFLALLLMQTRISVAGLNEWASEVLKLEPEFKLLGSTYKLPATAKWQMAGAKPGAMLEPLAKAYNGVWHRESLDAISTAMQAWRGP